tara:strand:+ start:2002 stop:2886 length:885 start_codon:yes stop_codon:yes gene_type:complete
VIKGDLQMNWRKQAVEKAIVDLERHREDLKKVKEEIHWSDPPAEEIAEIMKQLFRERANIANRIFMNYPPSYPNNRYYDPDPDSPFRIADFQNSDAESLTYPLIVGRSTLRERYIDSTIERINLFIKQLKVKSRRRSDFQENISYQLTEAKLKQMIFEALGEESLDELLSQRGFEPYKYRSLFKGPTLHHLYNSRSWYTKDGKVEFTVQYNIVNNGSTLKYEATGFSKRRLKKRLRHAAGKRFRIAFGEIELDSNNESHPKDLKTEENLKKADELMLSIEKEEISQQLMMYASK